MKLVLIGQGQWTVYAICSDETTCPLLDFLAELDAKRAARVLADLREFVPHHPRADWARSGLSWPLRGTDILEFKWRTKRGGSPRVFYFFDEGKVVVCTHGLNKKSNALDPREIREAEAAKASYLKAREAKQLRVVQLEDFDPPGENEGEEEHEED